MLAYHGAVVHSAANAYRRANNAYHIASLCSLKHIGNLLLHTIKQSLLCKEVLTRVARNRQFGEHQYLHAALVCVYNKAFYLLYVVVYIGDPHLRYRRSNSYISVIHKSLFYLLLLKVLWLRGMGILPIPPTFYFFYSFTFTVSLPALLRIHTPGTKRPGIYSSYIYISVRSREHDVARLRPYHV